MSFDSEIPFPCIYSKKIIQKTFITLRKDLHGNIIIPKQNKQTKNLGCVPYSLEMVNKQCSTQLKES